MTDERQLSDLDTVGGENTSPKTLSLSQVRTQEECRSASRGDFFLCRAGRALGRQTVHTLGLDASSQWHDMQENGTGVDGWSSTLTSQPILGGQL